VGRFFDCPEREIGISRTGKKPKTEKFSILKAMK